MNILLTNDDGYNATGIKILQEILKDFGTVYLIAPFSQQSGVGTHFSLNRGFTVTKHDDYIYSIDGTPVDVILLANQIFDVKFDLLVSGCNNGPNISYDSLYSGTVAAAIEGLNHSLPSMAISTDYEHFDIVKKEVKAVIEYVFKHKLLSTSWCLNINFPLKKFNKSKGLRLCKEFRKTDGFYYWEKDGKYYTDRHEDFKDAPEDSDVYAFANGYISICPLKASWFDEKTYKKLQDKIKNS